MKLKKSIIITLFLCLLMIGSVSAAENVTGDKVSIDVNDDSISTHNDNVEKSSQSDTTLREIDDSKVNIINKNSDDSNNVISKELNSENNNLESNVKDSLSTTHNPTGNTFEDIQNSIDSANIGDTISLSGNYIGSGTHIKIAKTLTIEGNGATLDAKGLSKIFEITGTNVLINNITFINGKSASAGAIDWWTGDHGYKKDSNGILMNCNFINCSAEYYAGAVYFFDNSLTMHNCYFTNNTANNGGAVYIAGNNCSLINSRFEKNNATRGGAVYIAAYNCNYNNSKFEKNNAMDGSDWYIEPAFKYNRTFTALQNKIDIAKPGSIITLEEDYTYNDAFDSGIVIYKPLTINGNNHIIDGNNQSWIFEITNNGIVLNNINFYNIQTKTKGGAIYSEKYLEINNCSFINNHAYYGGSIYSTKNLKLNSCLFINNTAGDKYGNGNGASIYCENNLYLYNCTFTNHDCRNPLGYYTLINTENLYIFNTEFSNNIGDLINPNNTTTIENCNFKNNTGELIYTYQCDSFKIINSTFLDNNYLNSAWSETGTLLRLIRIPNLEITNCNFINNNPTNTIIYLGLDNGIISNCNFSNNQVSNGVIQFGEFFNYENDGSVNISIIDSIFKNNIPIDFGGEITINNNSITITTSRSNVEEIIVAIADKLYKSSFTSKQAKIDITDIPTGNYTAKITYFGDEDYVPFEINIPITIENPNTQTQPEQPQNNNSKENNNGKTTNTTTDSKTNTNNNSKIDNQNLNTEPNTNPTNTKIILKTIKITAPTKTTFKTKTKTKKYTVTLKNKNKPIKRATVKLTIKGKKYTVKTNNKGKATFKITKLNKKGTYKATITFKGNKKYKASKKTVKIIVK